MGAGHAALLQPHHPHRDAEAQCRALSAIWLSWPWPDATSQRPQSDWRRSSLCLLTADPLDFADSLELFTNLVAELNEEYTRGYGFGIHSAAWAATLLSRNRALRIEELDTPEDPYYEFVGPDIDLGFRLIKHCPVGRVIVPGDLPVMLNGYGLMFEQIGTASLQGVTLDPYPVLLTRSGKI